MPELGLRVVPNGGNDRKSLMTTGWDKANREIDRMEFGEVRPARVAGSRMVAVSVEAVIASAQRQGPRLATDTSCRLACQSVAEMIEARPASP